MTEEEHQNLVMERFDAIIRNDLFDVDPSIAFFVGITICHLAAKTMIENSDENLIPELEHFINKILRDFK